MNEKYKLLLDNTKNVNGKQLYRIVALKDIGSHTKANDIGGYIESERNLDMSDNARVSGNARAYDNARVSDNAVVSRDEYIKYGILKEDLSKNLTKSIEVQCNLPVINGEVYCYKQVNSNLTSYHDSNFQYIVNELAEVKNPEINNKSCVSGFHVSNLTYWNAIRYTKGDKYLFCKVLLEDIITVQEGKIRCKKLFVIGICDNQI